MRRYHIHKGQRGVREAKPQLESTAKNNFLVFSLEDGNEANGWCKTTKQTRRSRLMR
ncbi:MAG: hypothetical protein JRM88_00245 [Nitrososphaerota archaeon]|nr:hypothetical protein [Nitrososphaerota archaeon]